MRYEKEYKEKQEDKTIDHGIACCFFRDFNEEWIVAVVIIWLFLLKIKL